MLRKNEKKTRLIIIGLVLCLVGFSSINSMEILKNKYYWPEKKPNVEKNSWSMFINGRQLAKLLNSRLKLVVELGSWMGASTRFILDHAPKAEVIAIDHWRGSFEHNMNPNYQDILPKLYEIFLVNCWQYKNRLTPMKTTTQQGMQEIYSYGLKPDLFYVDASHDYDSVLADLEAINRLFPGSKICGDDFNWSQEKLGLGKYPVRKAVLDFANKNNFRIKNDNEFWEIVKLYRNHRLNYD